MKGKRYIAVGLNMMDRVHIGDQMTGVHLGGIPMYGFAGMRLWSDSIAFAARVGKDFYDSYGEWYEQNKLDKDDPVVVSDITPYNDIYYDENHEVLDSIFFTGDFKDSNFWRPHGEDFVKWIGSDTRGMYTCSSAVDPMWDEVFKLKKQYGFKIMWEPNYASTFGERKEETEAFCQKIEMASFNVVEGCRIFKLENEEQLLNHLCGLGCELVLLRCGERGLYVIHGGKATLIPSAPTPAPYAVVDTTGCGNTSTAGAMVAWCEGFDPIMTGIMANISSNYNLRQHGPYPCFTDSDIAEARRWADEMYRDFTVQKGD